MSSMSDEHGEFSPAEAAQSVNVQADVTETAASVVIETVSVTTEPPEVDVRRVELPGMPSHRAGAPPTAPPPRSAGDSIRFGYRYSTLATPNLNDPPPTDRYCCPRGDYTWEQLHVGDQVPKCPHHGTSLIPCE